MICLYCKIEEMGEVEIRLCSQYNLFIAVYFITNYRLIKTTALNYNRVILIIE